MHAAARAQHVRCARVDPGPDAPARRDRGPSADSARSETDSLLRCYPRSVYNGVVREKGNPQILTLNPEYFLITQGIGRFIYRLARRAAGKTGIARYGLKELHKRSGSLQGLPQFAFQVR